MTIAATQEVKTSVSANVNPVNTDAQDPVVFSQAAARKVQSLIEEEGNPNLKLRVYITGGGCSGFQYGFTFDEQTRVDDVPVVTDGVTLLIDPMSLMYLMGAEIDYKEDVSGSEFVIRNPNAKTTCGCGSSFDMDTGSDEE